MSVTDTIFLGHIGEKEMASAAIAESWAWSMLYLVIGVSFALDTMISQAFGAKNYRMIGVVYQTSVAVGLILSVPIGFLWYFTESFMILLQQDAEIAQLAGTYIKYLMPSIIPVVIYRCTERFLQNQKIMYPGMIVNLIGIILNGILNYLFIFTFKMGFVGSPLSSTVCKFIILFSLWGIILYKGYHKEKLDKLYSEAFHPSQIWKYLKLGLPSAGMLWFEVFGFNGYTLLVGMLKEDALTAAQAVGFNCLFLSFIVPLGFSVGISTRVGNLVGEKNAKGAKYSAKFGLVFTSIWMVVQGSIVSIFGKWISMAWTSEAEVLAITPKLFVLVGIVSFFDGIQSVCGALLRAVGRPTVGAIVNLVGHWIIGLPLGALLAFVFYLGIYSFWWSLLIGLIFINLVYIIYIVRIDWEEEVRRSEILTESKQNDAHLLITLEGSSGDMFLSFDGILHNSSSSFKFDD